ncbi:MAG: redoxin domain-containing protein [Alphaproteobacteria bacterium]|nr:redoxin domain-containing protein [Alphaproteobacteria bacterium]
MASRSAHALLAALVLAVAGASLAATLDSRGWHEGKAAANAARVLDPFPDGAPSLELPPAVARRIHGPTLLVYFSPTCPHCQHVAPELAALAAARAGSLTLLGVAVGSSNPADVKAFRKTYGWTFDVITDTDHAIGSAMGATGTPSALLVHDGPDGALVVDDMYYPYSPHTDTLVAMRLAPTPFAVFTPGTYQGNRACAACHVAEQEAWLVTHHSVAWHTLEADGKQDDPACTRCHVTGAGQPGGWDGRADSGLVDVGCEACHGPGGPHDGQSTDPSTVCTGCHDAEHSIAFSYAKGLPLLDHFKTVELTGDELRAQRVALLKGEAPRELLAFADAPTVGADACKACHAEAHASMSKGPHAHAMATLKKGHADGDVACVRCHATSKAGGLPASTLDGYRTDEGVGCEACHGPGGAHVAAGGGTDTIVGLGKSCPVCVVEAVCTRCHTSQWDADWKLDDALPSVRAEH